MQMDLWNEKKQASSRSACSCRWRGGYERIIESGMRWDASTIYFTEHFVSSLRSQEDERHFWRFTVAPVVRFSRDFICNYKLGKLILYIFFSWLTLELSYYRIIMIQSWEQAGGIPACGERKATGHEGPTGCFSCQSSNFSRVFICNYKLGILFYIFSQGLALELSYYRIIKIRN